MYISEKIWEIYHKLSKEYYPILRIWVFFQAAVIIHHPDDMEVNILNL